MGPPNWIHNLEHGALVVLYRNDSTGATSAGQQAFRDFYDAFPTADGAWGLVIGDVCGKGPEAAVVTGLARYTIRAVALRYGQACTSEIDFIRAVLPEATVERILHMVAGAPRCAYEIRPDKNQSENQSQNQTESQNQN